MKFFDKILIANRGEIAVRIIRTAKDSGIQTIAVYAPDDADSLHVSLADKAIVLAGDTLAETYLNQKRIIRLAKENGVQAIHPGYGFLSENAEFAERVEKQGLVFIGATPGQIALMGEKTRSIDFVKKLKLPVIPGLHGTINDIVSNASELSFPVLVKASGGGGGKGMLVVGSMSELPIALQKAQRQAVAYFSHGGIFIEKYLPRARHIEVQVFGDGNGNAVHLFERECSIQRRYQKLIEESPATSISNKLKEKLYHAALKIAGSIQYRGAGTIEFLIDEEENFYFLEMNTRLQVEHPVTEITTGFDLVEWQLQIAAGNGLPKTQSAIKQNGHAIELRLCAEDPLAGFHPVPGKIDRIKIPDSPDFRLDSFLNEGMQLSSHYDSLLGKVIVAGNNRDEAIEKLLSVSGKMMLPGLKTNLSFLRQILKDKSFRQNKIDTCFVENQFGQLKDLLLADRSEFQKAIPFIVYSLYHFYSHKPKGSAWERMGYHRPFNKFIIELEGETKTIQFKKYHTKVEFRIDGDVIPVSGIKVQGDELSFRLNEKKLEVLITEQCGFTWVQLEGHQFKLRSKHILPEAFVNKKDPDKNSTNVANVFAGLFGKVIKTHVKTGDHVQEKQLLLTIESMKTEFRILSPSGGTVKQLHVGVGSFVQDKQLLIEFESKDKISTTT